MIRSEVSIDDFKNKADIEYPYFRVVEPFSTFPLVFGNLEKGDTPFIVTFNGDTRVVGKVSLSAYNVEILLRACGPLLFATGPDKVVDIISIIDYLEVVQNGFDN